MECKYPDVNIECKGTGYAGHRRCIAEGKSRDLLIELRSFYLYYKKPFV